ncbi:hypothetical protein CY35_09G070500 [Sphagnum magellanicum]|nr:hypothetical protein CY35_09G070500 [Sphagnum magellanicum]KAH9552521.1 hypothetical protein CY35_09G070500 [Sphagnum magellanicum]
MHQSMLGVRPSAEAVEAARHALAHIDFCLLQQLEKSHVMEAGRKEELKEAAEREKLPYKSLIHINNSYEEMAKHGGVNFDAKLKLFAVIDGAAAAEFDFGDQLDVKNPHMFLHQTEDQKYDFLELSGQGLKYVPENVQKMFALSSLILSNNRLETVPETIAGLTNLMTLDVQSNQLQALPDAIGSLKKLKKLNVSGNLLKVLPESIGSCSNLLELSANFNQLEVWPTSFGSKLLKLEKLCLQLNNLMGLPESIGELGSLRILDLHFNKLRSLPPTIGKLLKLEALNVSSNFNNLTSLPHEIGELISLTHLDLSFNQIRELPPSLAKLKMLKTLKLDQNPLMSPPMDVVEHSHEAVVGYLDHLSSDLETKMTTCGGIKVSCLNIPSSPRRDNIGGWVPVRGGGSWMNSLLSHLICGNINGMHNGSSMGKLMRWQGYHSDDDFHFPL